MTSGPADDDVPLAPTDTPAGSIVVGIDGSPQADAALTWAVEEAERRDLPLHLVSAREAHAMPSGVVEGAVGWDAVDLDDGSDRLLQTAVARVHEMAPGHAVTTSRPWGSAAQVLVAASTSAAFIVVGTRGRSRLTAAVLGTVSWQTAAHARCPVVVVGAGREKHRTPPGHVVVGVDGSKDSVRALRFAFESAGVGGRVTAVSAWWLEVVDGVVVTTPESPQWSTVVAAHENRLRKIIGDLPVEFPQVELETRVERAHAAEVLLAASTDADLLVVGSRGRGGFAGLMLGSVSQHMLTGASCPVAVVSRRGA